MHHSEFEHYFVRATNDTEHPKLKKPSIQAQLIDEISEAEDKKGGKLDRKEIEDIFKRIDNRYAKASRNRKIQGGHLVQDERAEITREAGPTRKKNPSRSHRKRKIR